jgi:hypothetical protein
MMFIRYDWVQLMQMTADFIEDQRNMTDGNIMAYIDQLHTCGLDDEAKIYETSLRRPNLLYHVYRNSDGSYMMFWGGRHDKRETQKDHERLVLPRLEFVPGFVQMSFLAGRPTYLNCEFVTFLKGAYRLLNTVPLTAYFLKQWPHEFHTRDSRYTRLLCPTNAYGNDYSVGMQVLQRREQIFQYLPGTHSERRMIMGAYSSGKAIEYMYKQYPRYSDLQTMVSRAALTWARSQKEETGGTYCE